MKLGNLRNPVADALLPLCRAELRHSEEDVRPLVVDVDVGRELQPACPLSLRMG
jgi:hypothetical protein